jgi:hypothetical protein
MSTFFDFEFIDEFKYYILWQNIETNKMIDILFQYMDANPMFIEDRNKIHMKMETDMREQTKGVRMRLRRFEF